MNSENLLKAVARRAKISMEARSMTHTVVKVLRNQQEELIDSKEPVPGDILFLNEGEAVGKMQDAFWLYP